MKNLFKTARRMNLLNTDGKLIDGCRYPAPQLVDGRRQQGQPLIDGRRQPRPPHQQGQPNQPVVQAAGGRGSVSTSNCLCLWHFLNDKVPHFMSYKTPRMTMKLPSGETVNKILCGFAHHDNVNCSSCTNPNCKRLHIPPNGWDDVSSESKAALVEYVNQTPDVVFSNYMQPIITSEG